MYIAANIDDCALVINEFLPLELFNKISKYNYSEHSLLKSTNDWNNALFKDVDGYQTVKSVYQLNNLINKDIIFKEFLNTIKTCSFIPFTEKIKFKMSYYEYPQYSGINWHDDGPYGLNYSFYIHENWDKNWGGETLIDTKRGLPLVTYPMPNTMLVVKNDVWHKVCAITGPQKRKVLQVRGFFT